MKKSHQNVIILSAESNDKTFEGNRQRTLNLKGCLEDLNISHNEALGVRKESQEVSFVCLPKNSAEIEVLKDFAFENFNQESVLYQDVNGLCHLEYEDGTSESIGRFRTANAKEIELLENYTVLNGVVYTTGKL